MLLLLATGAGAWAWGYPFLTSHTLHLSWPGPDGMHLPSAFFFDLGVFAVVVGTVLLMLTSVAHQSVRAHRAAARGDAHVEPEIATETETETGAKT
jgi:multicomponent K+:H+ antiporter subunit A